MQNGTQVTVFFKTALFETKLTFDFANMAEAAKFRSKAAKNGWTTSYGQTLTIVDADEALFAVQEQIAEHKMIAEAGAE